MRKSSVSEYGFINAKLRARISNILTDDFKRLLINSADIEEAVIILGDNDFSSASEIWKSTADIQSVEFELFKSYVSSYKLVMKNTDGELNSFVNILTIKPEIDNIKTAIRLWYGSKIRKRPVSYKASYLYKERIYENIDWSMLINAVSWEDITIVFSETIYKDIFDKDLIIDSNNGLFKIETELDRLYYRHIIENSSKLKKSDDKILKEIISTEIDLQNISWLIRYRHFYKMEFSEIKKILIPGGNGLELDSIQKTESADSQISPFDILKKDYPELSSLSISDKHNFAGQAVLFEQLLDDTRKRKFNSILAGYPFTIGIILVYFFMAERELKFISSVLNGKNYNFTSKRIEELVR